MLPLLEQKPLLPIVIALYLEVARRALAPERSFGSAVGWTVLGTLIPGLGLLRGGRRVLGSAILLLDVLVLGGLAYVAFGARSQLTTWLVSPAVLIGLAVTLAVLAVGLVLVVGATHLSLRPSSPTVAQRVGGGSRDDTTQQRTSHNGSDCDPAHVCPPSPCTVIRHRVANA